MVLLRERLAIATETACDELRLMLLDGATSDQVGGAARDCAAAWETSLRVSNSAWTNSYLAQITDDLRSNGWSAADSLDIVRRANNNAKHGSTAQLRGDEILAALVALRQAIAELSALVPGLGKDQPVARTRTVVVAVYDFIAQGEVNITFYSASPTDTWMTVDKLDNVQIEVKDENKVFASLEKLKGWRWDPPEFDAFEKSLRESDNELWRLGVFTDAYEDALKSIVSYQHSMDVLRGLHREDDATNVVVTLALMQATSWNESGVLHHAATLFKSAEPELHGRQDQLSRLAELVTAMIAHAISVSALGSITVDRVSLEKFQLERRQSPLAISEEIGALVSREGTVLVSNLR